MTLKLCISPTRRYPCSHYPTLWLIITRRANAQYSISHKSLGFCFKMSNPISFISLGFYKNIFIVNSHSVWKLPQKVSIDACEQSLNKLAFGHFLVYFWLFVKVLIGNNLLLQVQSAKFRFLFQVTQFECDPISSIV